MHVSSPLFRSEYEIEMEGWLRTRFRRLCYIYIVFEAVALLINFLQIGRIGMSEVVIPVLAAAAKLGVVIAFLRAGRWEHASREPVIRAATLMILLLGGATLLSDFLILVQGYKANLLGSLFFWHLTACLFLPWTPRESLRPIVPLLGAWAIVTVVYSLADGAWLQMLALVLSPIILIPGLLICSWRLRRHGRQFHTRMIGKHFRSMREEFQRARAIHESMFPKAHSEGGSDGRVRFDYAYAPMTEIGGDYVHLHVADDGCRHLTLIDVTGHGLVAALTVNRLFGELERIRAESPHAEPEEVLTLLNRYFYLTLQRHMIYATAIAITLDPHASEVRWCSAGHPPAYLRGANGNVCELGATETLLGALDPDEFNANQKSMQLAPGDALIAYTDGVFESRDRAGEQFGLDRLRQVIAAAPTNADSRGWPLLIADAVQRHANGRVEDDVLVAALTFDPIEHEARPRREEAALIGSGSTALHARLRQRSP